MTTLFLLELVWDNESLSLSILLAVKGIRYVNFIITTSKFNNKEQLVEYQDSGETFSVID